MAKGNGGHDRATKWIRWIARIWSLPIIFCALLVLLGCAWNWMTIGVADPYAVEEYPPIEALPPILIFVSVLGLGISWRRERSGGTMVVVFQLAALLVLCIHSPLTRDLPRLAIPYLLSMIVTIPGVLFLVCWRRSK